MQGFKQFPPTEPLPIFTYFNRQRFVQHGCMDSANFYGVLAEDTKNTQALYPCMGRQHISTPFGENKLIYNTQPKRIFKTINYFYTVEGTQVIQTDKFYNEKVIGTIPLGATVWYAVLPVGKLVYAMITAGGNIYVITEDNSVNPSTVTMRQVTDANAPVNAAYVASFGNRFVVSSLNTPDYSLTDVNLGAGFNPATAFTIGVLGPLFNRASGVIGQMCTLHNQLYILCDFTTDIWGNIPSQLPGGISFPWKQNTSYNWDTGIADPESLSVDSGRMVWLGRNTSGLITFMASNGQQPQDISTQAVNVLIQNSSDTVDNLSTFVTGPVFGFLYQYENTVFYRVSAGNYIGYSLLDIQDSADSIEFNFSTKRWGRVIELNGERNRIQQHVFFNNTHIVSVANDTALYQMAGNIYHNELRTPNTNPQDINAFTKFPMRYSLTTQQIFEPDYSEFITDYVEIDFVFGNKTFYKSDAPFDNTVFIITEDSRPDCPTFVITEDQQSGQDVFVITEDGNTPGFSDNHYNALFKPHIELYISDDGGETFLTVDLREFSRLGQYRWRMRWYELGTSRNRVYRLVCVSSAPIVILGAVQSRRRSSGGAN